jgi:hypothetical protein
MTFENNVHFPKNSILYEYIQLIALQWVPQRNGHVGKRVVN